jgi:hypothetical protein
MEDDEYGLSLPLDDLLFEQDLFGLLDSFGTPGEQPLHLNPGAEDDDLGGHTAMEGVEASQPTDSEVVGVSDGESEEDIRMEDRYVPDSECRREFLCTDIYLRSKSTLWQVRSQQKS